MIDTVPLCMVIDAQPLVRRGVRDLLIPDYEVEELPDGRGAVELLTSVGSFDVAIVEMRSADDRGCPSGTATIKDMLGAQPALGIVAHGGPVERHAVREALDAGAAAYVSKRSEPGALLQGVEAAAQQEAFIDPAAGSAPGNTGVTRRQRQVLQLFADGLSTEQAACRLGLSEETVRTHAKACLARLGARDRTHAVAIALRGSLID